MINIPSYAQQHVDNFRRSGTLGPTAERKPISAEVARQNDATGSQWFAEAWALDETYTDEAKDEPGTYRRGDLEMRMEGDQRNGSWSREATGQDVAFNVNYFTDTAVDSIVVAENGFVSGMHLDREDPQNSYWEAIFPQG